MIDGGFMSSLQINKPSKCNCEGLKEQFYTVHVLKKLNMFAAT